VLGPVIEAVERVELPEDPDAPITPGQVRELLTALGPKTFRRMDSTDLEERIADALFQSGAIGVVSATPGRGATPPRGLSTEDAEQPLAATKACQKNKIMHPCSTEDTEKG